jgi:hypothetical protein
VNNICQGGQTGCSDDTDCDPGQTCNTLTSECEGGGGGGSGGNGGGGAGGGAGGGTGGNAGDCVNRSDCGLGEVCDAGSCAAQPNNCAVTDDCGNGNICSGGACIAGCESNADCGFDAAAARCNLGTGQCEACRLSLDCGAGRVCNNGTCEAPPGCTTGGDCSAGLGCVEGTCGVCTASAQCAAGQECTGGACRAGVGCDNTQCQQIGATWFCDAGTGQCFSGCNGDADCFGGQTCNLGTHQCVGSAGGNCVQNLPGGRLRRHRLTAAAVVCSAGEADRHLPAADACCATAGCTVSETCVSDGNGACHCEGQGGGTGCVDQAASDICDQTCAAQLSACDYNTCSCGGGGGGGCGSANCDACCGGMCTALPGFCPALRLGRGGAISSCRIERSARRRVTGGASSFRACAGAKL